VTSKAAFEASPGKNKSPHSFLKGFTRVQAEAFSEKYIFNTFKLANNSKEFNNNACYAYFSGFYFLKSISRNRR
jgi:hypothetical protein